MSHLCLGTRLPPLFLEKRGDFQTTKYRLRGNARCKSGDPAELAVPPKFSEPSMCHSIFAAWQADSIAFGTLLTLRGAVGLRRKRRQLQRVSTAPVRNMYSSFLRVGSAPLALSSDPTCLARVAVSARGSARAPFRPGQDGLAEQRPHLGPVTRMQRVQKGVGRG